MNDFTRALLAVALVMPSAMPAQRTGDDPFGAIKYFHDLRAYPADRIPARARESAMAQMRLRWPRSFELREAAQLAAPSSSTSWVPIGPAPLTNGSATNSGRVNSIAVDPGNPLRIFIGGAQGGVWRTIDGGASWTPLTDAQCSLAMGSVVIDPVNTQIIYAGTGEQNFSGDSFYGCGVLRSADGGATWVQLGSSVFQTSAGGAKISRIVIDKTTAGSTSATTIFAASDLGLYRSTNSAATWTSVLTGIVTDLVANPTTPSTLYAAVGYAYGSASNGVYRSVDGGLTFTKLSGGLPTSAIGRIALAISPSNPLRLYVAVQTAIGSSGTNDGKLLGIWTTVDGGTVWTQSAASVAFCAIQCWYDMVLAVDPVTPSTVYFGGFSTYKSVDSATTFTDIGQSIHVDVHALAFDTKTPATVYSGNDGGVFASANAGTTWTSLNTNLSLTQFYAGVSMSPASATLLLGGTQDNGTLQWGGSQIWPAVIGGDGGYTAINPLTPTTMFGETQWTQGSTASGPRRKDASTTFFSPKNSGINVTDPAAFIPPIAMDLARPRILYFGTNMLYRTANSGDSWTAISPTLGKTTSGFLNAIGVAQSDSLTVYAGTTDGQVQYTHDLGVTWSLATGLANAAVSDFAVDPRDAKTAFVTFHGFAATKVYKTVNGGASWTNITFDLPNIPVLAIVFEPGTRDLDIGTDLGVFTLRDGTTSWSPIVAGLPNVAVYDLVYDAPRGRLIAATHGRGMFTLDVNVVALRGDITGDGQITALDAQAILAAVVGNALPAGARRFPNGDANCDGEVTAVDALLVLAKVVGQNTAPFCVGTVR
jgi:hypothetical protein